jgi:uncharacterized protein YgiM (DUF1202 family)
VKYRVKDSYEPAFAEGLVINKGQKLRYERKPTEWAGWIWCTAENGQSAWVPESWVELGDEFCVLSRDYSSRELSIRTGEWIEVELVESGWAWVRNSRDESGWVPEDRIEPEHKGTA